MLVDKDLLLITMEYAKEDRAKSWYFLWSTLILLIVAYMGAIVNVHLIPQLLCGLLAGLLSVRMFMIYHDWLHKSILQHSLVARVILSFYGLFTLTPVSIWRRTHNYHHTHNSKLYTSSIGSFPLVTKEEFLAANQLDRNIYLLIRHPVTIAMGYIFTFIWGMCLRSFLSNTRKHADSLLALLLHFGIGGSIYYFFGWQSLLIGFLLPAFLKSAIGAYLFYAQHNFPTATYKSKEEWNFVYAALHSSSYMKMNPVMRWFTGSIGYHHIHHLNHKIPFYNLSRAYREVEAFQQAPGTSLSIRDIYHCFRVKLWDPEAGKMIGLQELYG